MFFKEIFLFIKKLKKRDSVCNCIRNISYFNEQRVERVFVLNLEEKKKILSGDIVFFFLFLY